MQTTIERVKVNWERFCGNVLMFIGAWCSLYGMLTALLLVGMTEFSLSILGLGFMLFIIGALIHEWEK